MQSEIKVVELGKWRDPPHSFRELLETPVGFKKFWGSLSRRCALFCYIEDGSLLNIL
jgi:hypothetical protein